MKINETVVKWFLFLWKIKWLRGTLLRYLINKLSKDERSTIMLTPNTNVADLEKLGFTVGDLLYATKLRALLIEAIDSPDHMYDERLLAAADGAFGYKLA